MPGFRLALSTAVIATVLSACDASPVSVPSDTGGSAGLLGTGGTGAGGKTGATPSTDAATDVPTFGSGGAGGAVVVASGGVWGSGGVAGSGGGNTIPVVTGGAVGRGGTTAPASGGGSADASASGGGGSTKDAAAGAGGTKDAAAGAGGTKDAAAGAGGNDVPGSGGAWDTGPVGPDPCNPAPPSGYHTIHFRYLWAGQRTFTLFPRPEHMPTSVEMDLKTATQTLTVTCAREQDRPWFNCPVPDSYFATGATWRVADRSHNPEWNTVKPGPLPGQAKEYWLRWQYGRPDIPRDRDPANFEFLDYYPDAAHGDWSAMGQWNDGACVSKPPAAPLAVGFGGWFPYGSTQYLYPYGGSLAYLYPDVAKAQHALDAFVFQRYQIWKKNYIVEGSDACGDGTARVRTEPPETVSEGQGYGVAIAAAIGDKDLFGKLWSFVRHYRSPAKYCGLVGWMWSGPSDCQAIDTFATGAGNHDSAFDGDADIGIGLLFAALQWPEYTDAATDWLLRMECEVNPKYGDGFNYPTRGDSWDKTCQDADHCDYEPGTASAVFNDYYPPGYFRTFGDFLAARLGGDAMAANGQTHHDFWYKTAETVWELIERCYDQTGVHPGLIGNGGDVVQPCKEIGGGEPYEWARTFWRIGIDAAWFGDNPSLPENAANSSRHYPGKSRMQAKLDNVQGFYADFYKKNPPEPNANRFSSLCHQLAPDGAVTNCDPAYGHHSYTVNMPMSAFVSLFGNAGATTSSIRREALEEAATTTVLNDHYFQESLGVYSMLFLTGNFPNPMTMPK